MNDLLKKLNVLVKSTVHDALSSDSEHQPPPTAMKIGTDTGREVGQLRQRINDALAFENQLQTRVESLKADVAKWDQQADDAVAAGNNVQARYAIEQLQLAQQRLAMAEADLRDHQRVTVELITKVNTLDAAAADARRSESDKQEKPQESPVPPGQPFTEKLDDLREKLKHATDSIQTNTVPAVSEKPVEDEAVEDDLARRRQRLSKPE